MLEKSEHKAGLKKNKLSGSIIFGFLLTLLSATFCEPNEVFAQQYSPTQLDPINFLASSYEEFGQDNNSEPNSPNPCPLQNDSSTTKVALDKEQLSHEPNGTEAAPDPNKQNGEPTSTKKEVGRDNNSEPNSSFAGTLQAGPIFTVEIVPEPEETTHELNNLEASADCVTQTSKQPPEIDTSPAGLPGNLMTQLLNADYTAPEDPQGTGQDSELYKLIRKIHTIEFAVAGSTVKSAERSGAASISTDGPPANTDESAQAQAEIGLPRPNREDDQLYFGKSSDTKQNLAKSEVAEPSEKMTDRTVQLIASALQSPGQLNSAFELAEVLFLSGRLTEAATVYKEALNALDPNDSHFSEDRAWILLQVGNCLRNEDAQTATKFYEQLTREHPDSLWADFAEIWNQLARWHLEYRPDMLVTRMESVAANTTD